MNATAERLQKLIGGTRDGALLRYALTESGDHIGAIAAYRDGIAAAERRGDVQAGKEMGAFLRRLDGP